MDMRYVWQRQLFDMNCNSNPLVFFLKVLPYLVVPHALAALEHDPVEMWMVYRVYRGILVSDRELYCL